jgi:predicted nucleotidyltransferase
MAKTALELTPAERRAYRPSLMRERQGREDVEEEPSRRQLAWDLARKAADLLRGQFGADKVVVFGSLVRERLFTWWSDIDLAAWGIPPDRFYDAVASVTALSHILKVDLVDVETCRSKIRDTIEREGLEL